MGLVVLSGVPQAKRGSVGSEHILEPQLGWSRYPLLQILLFIPEALSFANWMETHMAKSE